MKGGKIISSRQVLGVLGSFDLVCQNLLGNKFQIVINLNLYFSFVVFAIGEKKMAFLICVDLYVSSFMQFKHYSRVCFLICAEIIKNTIIS